MNIYLIDLIDINICSDSEIYENENTFTASFAHLRTIRLQMLPIALNFGIMLWS